MKRKRVVVMGFMGSMPIAGVIWQHIHYIVGLQRLRHDVYYIEDSARLPYNPETFEVTDEFDYAAKVLSRLAGEFNFKNRWAFCARYLPGNPTAGLPLKKIRQLYREADAILTSAAHRNSMTIYLFPIASFTSRATLALSKSRSTRA